MDIDDPELDPRLAALYDIENPWGDDDAFFLALVNRRPETRVVDVGCGTGRLTVALALAGHSVTGIDPNPSFLAIARTKAGADRVRWIRGTSADLSTDSFDIALMTSHVAQVFRSDHAWSANLAAIKRSLVPGGLLAFDTRDPTAEAWKAWDTGRGRADLPDGSVLYSSTTMTFVDDVAEFDSTMLLSDAPLDADPLPLQPVPGALWSRAQWGYRFRSPDLVRRSVEDAGFSIEDMYGGWHQEPLGQGVGEIVVVARA